MLIGEKVRLRPKRLEDALNDYNWRRDPELARLDAVTPLAISFEEYLVSHVQELDYTPYRERRFAIETLDDNKHIGNCLYFNIDKVRKEAELGIMIGDRDYWDKGYGADAVITLLNHIFQETNLERIRLKTLRWNIRAQKCFEKCGFVRCGQLISGVHNFVIMELRRNQWLQNKAKAHGSVVAEEKGF
jgi:RimJ/RimL family protein N-acetyltransferase